jgi:hypothetical protein
MDLIMADRKVEWGFGVQNSSSHPLLIFLSPLGERLGEGVNAKIVSWITPSPSLSPKGERSMSSIT